MNAEQREFWQNTSNHLSKVTARLSAYYAAFPDGPSPMDPNPEPRAYATQTTFKLEGDLHDQLVKELNARNIINWTMYRGTRKGGAIFATPGIPDIYLPGLGWLELKSETGSASIEQLRRHEELRRSGDHIAIVTSINEALETIGYWQAEK